MKVLKISIIVLFMLLSIAGYAYSYRYDFQKTKGISIEILTHEEFNKQFGDNPDIPLDDEVIIKLAGRLFKPYWKLTGEKYSGDPHNREYEIGLLFAALQNPGILDSTRCEVDHIMSENIPNLPRNYPSGHFNFEYTDNDPISEHNVTLAEIKAAAALLNGYWNTYTTNFKVPKHYISGTTQMIDVKVYYLLDNDKVVYGETHSSWNYISLNSKATVKDLCKRKTTSAHELFHRVQYSYGYVSGTANMNWIVEGTAAWAQKYTNLVIRDYMYDMNQGLNSPDKNLFAMRSYDAVHFWVYLEKRTDWSAIRDVWKQYEMNGHNAKKAVNTVTTARLNMNFSEFTWLWSRANYIKDLSNAQNYDYLEDEIIKSSCGIQYGPLCHVMPTVFALSDIEWSKSDKVKPFGTDYYKFPIISDTRHIEIKIDGQDTGNFSYSFVPIKNNSYLPITTTQDTDYTFLKTITPGQWDELVVVVSGGGIGGSYTISLNPCLSGTWVDNYGYTWNLSLAYDVITGTVNTGCGVLNVSGGYLYPTIYLHATNLVLAGTNPPLAAPGCCHTFVYTGTVSECKTASGTWISACDTEGSWSMTKN